MSASDAIPAACSRGGREVVRASGATVSDRPQNCWIRSRTGPYGVVLP